MKKNPIRLLERRWAEQGVKCRFAVQDRAPGIDVLEIEIDQSVEKIIWRHVLINGRSAGGWG
jgi:hypothetical protein